MPELLEEQVEVAKQESRKRSSRGPSANSVKARTRNAKPRKSSVTRKPAKEKNMHNKELGDWGEEIAANFLKRRGFSILERNWKCFAGEADIIALDDEALHFVEVKTRIGSGSGFPVEAVNARKRQRYEAISELYLSSYEGCETRITFDIIGVTVLPNDRIFVRIYSNVLSCDCG